MGRFSDDMKLWLFDLAHGNLNNTDILKGFIKHYVLYGCEIGKIQDDITFHTAYGYEGVERAMKDLRNALSEFAN